MVPKRRGQKNIRLPNLNGTYKQQLDECQKMYHKLTQRILPDRCEKVFLTSASLPPRLHSSNRELSSPSAEPAKPRTGADNRSENTGEPDSVTGRLRRRRYLNPFQLCHALQVRGKGDPRDNPKSRLVASSRLTWHELGDGLEREPPLLPQPTTLSDSAVLMRAAARRQVITRASAGAPANSEQQPEQQLPQLDTRSDAAAAAAAAAAKRRAALKTVRISTDDVIYRVKNWIEGTGGAPISTTLQRVDEVSAEAI